MKASELANQAIWTATEKPTKLYISAKLWRELTEEFLHTPHIQLKDGNFVRTYQGLKVIRIMEDGECFVR